MEKLKDVLKQKKVMAGIGIGLVALIGIGVILVNVNSKKINFTLKDNVIEYGEDSKKIDWLKKVETNGNKVSAEVDTKKLGQTEVEFNVCINDDCEKIKAKVEIKDTKVPDIKLKKNVIEIEQDSEFDPVSNIEYVKDVVDGDIKKTDKEVEKDGYYITGEVDSKTAGEYTVKVIAIDKNGNKTEKEYKVKVNQKEESNETGTDQEKTTESLNTPKTNTGTGGSTNGTGGNTSSNPPATQPSGGSGESNTPSPTPQPTPEPTPNPTPEPTPEPTALCPNGFNPAWPCDKVISGSADEPSNSGMWFGSMEEADAWAESESYKVGGQWEGYGWAIFDVEYNDGRQKWTVFFH